MLRGRRKGVLAKVDALLLDRLREWFHRGEYGRVIFTCAELLQDGEYASKWPLILFWKGVAHLESGPAWCGEAMSCFREGIALAKKDRPIKARLMAALGAIYANSGDCAQFEPLMQEYERLARGRNAQDVRYYGAFLWHNYGTALANAFRWAEAARAFTTSTDLARAFGLNELVGRGLHDQAGAHIELGNLKEAAQAMAEADRLLPDEEWGHKKLSRQAEYALAAGDLVGAQQRVTEALLHPRVDDITNADVHFTWARVLKALNRSQEAREKALRGLDYAARAVYYPGIHKLNRLLQRH